MSTKHWRGPTIPGPSDDLLQAWDTFTDTVGTITSTSSIASARAMLSTASAAGVAITNDHPAYFDISGVVYRCNGSKGDGGEWRLKPLNEVQRSEGIYSAGAVFTRAAGVRDILVTSTLAAAPYDRLVFASGSVSGTITLGGYSAGVGTMGGDWADAPLANTFAATGSDMSSATQINLRVIPAGVDPLVQLSIKAGGAATNRLDVTNTSNSCRLVAVAWPITMA